MADNQLQVILDEQGVAKENAKQLLNAFGAPFEEAGVIIAEYKNIKVTEEDQFDLMAEARSKRLALKTVRTGVEAKRKELKEDSLRTGRAIDSVAKFVKDAIQPAEEYLEQQEKFGELRAAERAARLKAERIEKLSKYTDDLSVYNLDALTDEQFGNLLATLKTQKEAELASAKKAEEERLAEIEAEKKRQAEIEAENARLKAEADTRDKKEAAEKEAREKAEAERQAEQAKKDAAAQVEADRIQKEADEKVAAEKAKAEALEQEKRDREAAEAKAKVDAEEAKRQSLLAPDKEKLLALATQLEEFPLPALSSKEAQAVLTQVEGLLDKVIAYIRGNVKGL